MQINSANQASILLIGSGRLACHLKQWNSFLEHPSLIEEWNRQQTTIELTEKIKRCQIVWLAISDSAIADFYENHLKISNVTVVHFSGAFYHEKIKSAHPLMSFPHTLFTKEVYSQIHFVIQGVDNLSELLPCFTNSYSSIPVQQKALYHALCVLAGNFPQMLWIETQKEFKKLGLPESALNYYVNQITKNFVDLGASSLTGPFVRKDNLTIEKNLLALQANSQLKNIYKSFYQEYFK